MSYEVRLNDRLATVELLSRKDNRILFAVDGKEYELDLAKVSGGKYSILHKNKSFNVEIIPGQNIKQYIAHTFNNSFRVEIIDAESKYLSNRMKGHEEEGERVVSAPIPGRVVKVLVKKGDLVVAGQTLIILSAMKMESEFKAKKPGKIISVEVAEGQIVEAKQELIIMEEI